MCAATPKAISAVTDLPVQSKAVESLLPAKGDWRWGCSDEVVWDKTCVMNVHKINYATNGDPLSCPHMCVLHMSMEQLLTVNGILGNEKKAWQCCSITTLSHLAVALTSACVGGCQTNSGTALANPWATGLVCEDRLQTAWTEQPPFQCSGSRAPSYPAGCSQEPSEAAL